MNTSQKSDIGIIGLSVMGRSLALNMADHGFKVSGYNRSASVTKQVMEDHPHKNLFPFYSLDEFVNSLEPPGMMEGPNRAPSSPPEIPTPR